MMKFPSLFASVLLLGKHSVLADVVSIDVNVMENMTADFYNGPDGPGTFVRDKIDFYFGSHDIIAPGDLLDDSELEDEDRRLSEAGDQEDLPMPESIEDVAPPVEEEDSNTVALRGSKTSRRLPQACPNNCERKKNWKTCLALGCKCTCGGRRLERGFNVINGNFIVHQLKNDINALLAIKYGVNEVDVDIERQYRNN
jgi:hypothetical protein